MGQKILLICIVSFVINFNVLEACDCNSGNYGLMQGNPSIPIFLQSPGGVSPGNNCTLDCNWLVGYNVTGTTYQMPGVKVDIIVCYNMTATDSIVITDGVTTWTIDSTLCNSVGQTPMTLITNTSRSYLNVSLTENNPVTFILQFSNGTLITNGPSPPPSDNPQNGRMDLAIAIDISYSGTDYLSRVKDIVKNLTAKFSIDPSISSDATRLSLVQITPQQSYGGSVTLPWDFVYENFTQYLGNLSPYGTQSASYYATHLLNFINSGFTSNTSLTNTITRPRTQRVFLVFAYEDMNGQDSSNIFQLARRLQETDVHTVVVNMGTTSLTWINSANQNITGSNRIQLYTLEPGNEVNGLYNNVLKNGNLLCAMYDPANAIIANNKLTNIPFKHWAPSPDNDQGYCNNMNFVYNYNATGPNVQISSSYETTPLLDFLDIYNGNALVASLAGINMTSTICIPNVSQGSLISFKFQTGDGLIYRGLNLTITDPYTGDCPTYSKLYRRKRSFV